MGFARDSGFAVIADGAIRSGKTFAAVVGFILYTQGLDRGYRHILGGRKLRVIETEILPHLQAFALDMGLRFNYKSKDGEVEIGKQSYQVIAGNDRLSKDRLQGLTCHSALIDEVSLVPEDYFETAVSRLSYDDSKAVRLHQPRRPEALVEGGLDRRRQGR